MTDNPKLPCGCPADILGHCHDPKCPHPAHALEKGNPKVRKLPTFDDHLFEQMKNREFFDAFFSEPCNKCIELEAERDRLKADKASLLVAFDNRGERLRKIEDDRDHWKELAGRMAEALETIIANPVAACSDRHDIVAQEALAAFRAAKGKGE